MNSQSNHWLAAAAAATNSPRSVPRRAAALLVGASLALTACGGDSSGPCDPPAPVLVASVAVAAAASTVEVGGLLQLTATARDASGNVIAGRATTWTSTNQGVATVNSAGLVNAVSAGNVTINATVDGVSGGIQLTITAPPPVMLSSVSPNPLVPGQSATLTGAGFSTVPAANVVSIGGTPAMVNVATQTSLTVTVPATLCTPPGSVAVTVTVGGRQSNPIQQPVQTSGTAVPSGANAGELTFLQSEFCLQFSAAAAETYLVGVQNFGSDVSNVTTASVALAASAPSPVYASRPEAIRIQRAVEAPPVDMARALRWARHREAERELRRRERALPVAEFAQGIRGQASVVNEAIASIPAVVNVGDNVTIRVPDRDDLCDNFFEITTVVKYVGTKSVWLEDTGNPTGGLSDTDYQNLANTFDSQILATITDYFGTPSDLDGNGRIVVVVTKEVNKSDILGFTTTADFSTSCGSSDNGEIYYARAVDADGQFGQAYTLEEALDDAPQLLAHEVTHIAQFSIRIFQSGFQGVLQTIWELEGQATFAEEVVGHFVTGHTTGQNYGFDVAWDCASQNTPCTDPDGIAWYIAPFVDMALYYGFDPDASDPQTIPIAGAPHLCSWLDLTSNGNTGPCYAGREVYGVPWLLLRYLSDQYGSQFPGGEKEFHRRMILGNRAGFDNIATLIGRPMDRLLAEWAATLYVDDRVPGADSRLTLSSWNLYDIEQRLVTPARLRPEQRSFGNFSTTVSVRAGSTAYFLISGARGASALRVRDPGEGNLPGNMRVWFTRID